jgi:ComF family protein
MLLSRVARVVVGLVGEVLAPTRCAACEELVAPRVIFCPSCAVSAMAASEQPHGQLSVFDYGGAVATAIVRLKYAGRSDLATRFEGVMASAAAPLAKCLDLVVPVPLHPRRLAERGFDQAALLAGPMARSLDIAYAPRGLVRTRETPHQASLDRAARVANVASAFRCVSPVLAKGKHVLLVDDVRTTGATLAACDLALRTGGAKDVTTLVLASRDLLCNSEGNVKKGPQIRGLHDF